MTSQIKHSAYYKVVTQEDSNPTLNSSISVRIKDAKHNTIATMKGTSEQKEQRADIIIKAVNERNELVSQIQGWLNRAVHAGNVDDEVSFALNFRKEAQTLLNKIKEGA